MRPPYGCSFLAGCHRSCSSLRHPHRSYFHASTSFPPQAAVSRFQPGRCPCFACLRVAAGYRQPFVDLPPLRFGIFQRLPLCSSSPLRAFCVEIIYKKPSRASTHSCKRLPSSGFSLHHPCSTRRRHAELVCRAAYRSPAFCGDHSTHPPASRLAAGAFTWILAQYHKVNDLKFLFIFLRYGRN